jgi:hypothetical protein
VTARLLPLLVLAACTMPPAADPPRTVAETSEGRRTSTQSEVDAFLQALEPLPHADRLSRHVFGATHEGRMMQVVVAAEPPIHDLDAVRRSGKLRLLVNANIHAGEVEGKEVVQAVLREIALGGHEDLLEDAVLLFVPIYNVDGNERIDRANRVNQNGPEEGVGTRANAQGLDLNRDFIKVEAPETRALIGLMGRTDPHLFMDLHTTNGSHHGYELTYSPSLSTGIDPTLDAFNRGTLLPQVRRRMAEAHGFATFDYGNFTGTEPPEWVTYDHRERFGTNYVGLRNRLSVLSEAYSYLDFPGRIDVTHAFVLEVLRVAVNHRAEIQQLTAAADARTIAGDWTLGVDSILVDAVPGEILVGEVDEVELPGLGTRIIRREVAVPTPMGMRLGFDSAVRLSPPAAWVLPDPTAEMVQLLEAHGVAFRRLTTPEEHHAAVFMTAAVEREDTLFQGHYELSLQGMWHESRREVPAGSLWVPADQALGRIAAQLLEPLSEDSASTWDRLKGWEEALEGSRTSPVWRISKRN